MAILVYTYYANTYSSSFFFFRILILYSKISFEMEYEEKRDITFRLNFLNTAKKQIFAISLSKIRDTLNFYISTIQNWARERALVLASMAVGYVSRNAEVKPHGCQ